MTKVLYLIRHAKSSWQDPSLSDHDRPLNDRGFRDAPFMAKLLAGKGVQADAIVSSTAKRAFTTATYFAEALGLTSEDIHQEIGIYEAYAQELLFIIQRLDSEWDTVCLFGHNPGFTNLANRFATDFIPNIPTCGIAQISGAITEWKDFEKGKVKLMNFYYPKQFQR